MGPVRVRALHYACHVVLHYSRLPCHGSDNEEEFANQFFNFMRKHLDIVIREYVPQVNLGINTGFTPSSAGSTPDNH
jgi:hypothetical protein